MAKPISSSAPPLASPIVRRSVFGLYTGMVYLICLGGGWPLGRIREQRAVLIGVVLISCAEFGDVGVFRATKIQLSAAEDRGSPSFAAFFNAGPSLAFPVADGLFVTLQRPPRWTLRAPVQLPQQLPHMPGTDVPAGYPP
jgi:hypothetical protein